MGYKAQFIKGERVGQLLYDATQRKKYMWNGTEWVELDPKGKKKEGNK